MESLIKFARKPRLHIVVGIILVFVGIMLEVFVSDKKQYHNTNCTQSAYEILLSEAPFSIENASEKSDNKDKKQKHFENMATCSDLGAQWQVAVITKRAYYIGIIGILLIFVTWIATREAVKVSRDSAQDELRAYISIEGVQTEQIRNGINIIVNAKNVGQTPASNVHIHRCFALGEPDELKSGNPALFQSSRAHWGSVASGGIRHGRFEITAPPIEWLSHRAGIINGRDWILVYGWIEYLDIYGREHATFFSAQMGRTSKIYGKMMNLTEMGNEMT